MGGCAEGASAPETRLVMVDGRDALCTVIVRPGREGRVVVEAAADGLDKAQAAFVLRQVADGWDPPAAMVSGGDGVTP